MSEKWTQAVLITAYEDLPFLKKNIESMSEVFEVFVHMDKKTVVSKEDILFFSGFSHVHYYSKYRVTWGSVRHIQAILYLLQQTKEFGKFKFYHILSGNTIGSRTYSKIATWFGENSGKNFIQIDSIEGAKYETELKNRIYKWNFLHLYNAKPCNIKSKINRRVWIGIGKLLDRFLPKQVNGEYKYKGYVYCHLSDGFVTYMFNSWNTVVRKCLKEIKYFWVGEEFFFQELLMNSSYADTVVDDSKIYDDWTSEERGMPAFLNINDLERIYKSEKLFARKISSKYSNELIDAFLISQDGYDKEYNY